MAPPVPPNVPPTQAGRFKPRKPVAAAAKKIQTPALASLEASQGVGSSTSSSGGRGRAGGGSGRFGRDGQRGGGRFGGRGTSGRFGGRDGKRGGGRFNIPQGQVFFTAAPTTAGGGLGGVAGSTIAGRIPVGSSSVTGIGGRGVALSASERRQMAVLSSSSIAQRNTTGADTTKSNEEIVGTLDEGIGSMASAVPSSVLSNNSDFISSNNKIDTARNAFERALLGEQYAEGSGGVGGGGGIGKIAGMFGADMYDTDTSDEEGGARKYNRNKLQQRKTDLIKPISLTSAEPPRRAVATMKQPDVTKSFQQSSTNHDNQIRSPFVMSNDIEELKNEKQSFFLFQLPTSLPPITMMDTTVVTNPDGTTSHDSNNTTDELAPVAIPSLQTSTFDNVLSKSISGKIGKIKIYKSGRTVLVFEGPDGQPVVSQQPVLVIVFPYVCVCVSHLNDYLSIIIILG
jgi:RNA polymerase III RPC4